MDEKQKKRFRKTQDLTRESFTLSEAYVKRNYDILTKVYSPQDYLALQGEVIIGHSIHQASLAEEMYTKFDIRKTPILVRRLEDFLNPPTYEMSSPELDT